MTQVPGIHIVKAKGLGIAAGEDALETEVG